MITLRSQHHPSRHVPPRRSRVTGRCRRLLAPLVCVVLGSAAITLAPSASAAPGSATARVCAGAGQAPVLVGRVPGAVLEGAVADPSGRLYVTDLVSGRLFRFDRPGAPAIAVATVPSGGGGALAWAKDGQLLVGYGADPRVFVGDTVRAARIARFDPATGRLTPWVSGLSAADGLAVARSGDVYATNDFGSLVGKISPTGAVNPSWASIPSANGAALTSDDDWLYVSRTFADPGVSRISTANPLVQQKIVSFRGFGVLAAADGLTLDSHDRPIVPTDVSGEILRVDGPGQFCALATGLPLSSVVTYGRGDSGFAAGRLYRAGFDGAVYEIPGGRDARR